MYILSKTKYKIYLLSIY